MHIINAVSGFAFQGKTLLPLGDQRGNFHPFFPSLSTQQKPVRSDQTKSNQSKLTRFFGGFSLVVNLVASSVRVNCS